MKSMKKNGMGLFLAMTAGTVAWCWSANADEVNAVTTGGAGAFRGDSGDGPSHRALPPGMPNLAEIPFRQMPDPARTIQTNIVSGVTIYDMTTGEAREMPVTIVEPNEDGTPTIGGLPFAGVGQSGSSSESGAGGTSFLNAMSVTGGLSTFPRSPNCKVAMRFGSGWSVCSGTMINEQTVLCAGHCVNDGGTGGTAGAWADEVYVFPAWDGGGTITPGTGTINNFGWGRATFQLLAGSNWVNNSDLSADMSNIGLDRSVGNLTGWYGYEYDGSCSYAQGVTWNNFSYPAQFCSGSLHNGQDMYYRTGTPDSCPTSTRLQFDTASGCTGAVWGGMSGSSIYEIRDNNRFAYAVCSTSNRVDSGTWTKMWGAYATDMANWINDSVRGATFDVEALDANFSSTVNAGGNFSLRNFLAANVSNADPGSATYTFHVYLSTNDNISASDTLLHTGSFTWDFGPLSTVRVNLATVNVPISVAPGNYYVGVLLDAATDGNDANDDTDTWDAVPVEVLAPIPGNDACASATIITNNTTRFGTNVGASNDGLTTCGTGASTGNTDVWYVFTPNCTTTYVLDTEGTNDLSDTVISVHSACPGTAANTIECNDDGGTGLLSRIEREFINSVTYYIRVTGYGGAQGAFQLNLTGPDASNDFCANADPIALYTPTPYSTCSASTSPPQSEPSCLNAGSDVFGQDLWFRYVADYSGPARVQTCDTSNGFYDTRVGVYASCPFSAGELIACNDDFCGLRSTARFDVVDGQDYIIRVGGYSATSRGDGILQVEEDCDSIDFNNDGVFPDNDDLVDFLRVFSGSTCGTCNDLDFNNDGVYPDGEDISALLRVLSGGRCYIP
jgi:glutamyl endopeptidase